MPVSLPIGSHTCPQPIVLPRPRFQPLEKATSRGERGSEHVEKVRWREGSVHLDAYFEPFFSFFLLPIHNFSGPTSHSASPPPSVRRRVASRRSALSSSKLNIQKQDHSRPPPHGSQPRSRSRRSSSWPPALFPPDPLLDPVPCTHIKDAAFAYGYTLDSPEEARLVRLVDLGALNIWSCSAYSSHETLIYQLPLPSPCSFSLVQMDLSLIRVSLFAGSWSSSTGSSSAVFPSNLRLTTTRTTTRGTSIKLTRRWRS